MMTTRSLIPVLLGAGTVLGSLLTTGTGTALGTTTCQARNVTQVTAGSSLAAMVAAAVDGDRLTVRGTCPGEVVIRTDLAIWGLDGAVLTGRGRTRIARVVADTEVTLRDLTLERGRGRGRGGAVANRGSLRLVDVTVQDSLVTRRDADRPASGGGIHNLGRLVIEDSVIRRNDASVGVGGGIATGIRGWTTLRRSLVLDNVSYDGGGLFNARSGRTTIVGSRIRRNVALHPDDGIGGGGIWNAGGALGIRRSTIRNNEAGGHGGGLYNDGGTATLSGVTFSINRARASGGGLHNSGTLSVVGGSFRANRANSGGGLSNWGTLEISASSFRANAASRGGGLFNDGTVRMAETTVTQNEGRNGGGVRNLGVLQVTGTTILANHAEEEGGGIQNVGGTIDLVSSTVTGNTAGTRGGGIMNVAWAGGSITLDAISSVTGNMPDDCVGTSAC